MSGIFNAIADFFAMIGEVFEFIFNSLISLFTLVADGTIMLTTLISALPAPFIAGGIGLITVCVLYKILGRENQS